MTVKITDEHEASGQVAVTVMYSIASDEDATRIHCVLGGLGYTPKRRQHDGQSPDAIMAWARQYVLGRVTVTPREVAVSDMLDGGRSLEEVAADLGLSAQTVEWCRDSVHGKLGKSVNECAWEMLDE